MDQKKIPFQSESSYNRYQQDTDWKDGRSGCAEWYLFCVISQLLRICLNSKNTSENQKIIWHLPSVLFSRHTNPFTVSVSIPNYTLHLPLTSQMYHIFFWSYGEKKNKWIQYQLTSEVYSTFKMQVHYWFTYQHVSCAILYAIDMSFPLKRQIW